MTTPCVSWESKLINGWEFQDQCCYFAWVLFFAIVIRLVMSSIRAWELWLNKYNNDCFGRIWVRSLVGIHYRWNDRVDKINSDYFYPFFIGLFEISAYPVLMVVGAWTVIGAWIVLKSVGQWKPWSADRTVFTRYLLGNLMVLSASYLFVRCGYVIARDCGIAQ